MAGYYGRVGAREARGESCLRTPPSSPCARFRAPAAPFPANVVLRPSARPFAAYSGHDPDGNVFDLAQRKGDTRKEIYADIAAQVWAQDRYINRFAIRTLNAEQVAEFYSEVFELKPVNGRAADGYHLTDGRVTLSILKWSPGKFAGMSVKRAGPDHVGFHVEDVVAFKQHVAEVAGINSRPVPMRP